MTNYSELSNEEIDLLIAERVLNWRPVETTKCGTYWEKRQPVIGALCSENYADFVPKFTASFDTCLEHLIPAMWGQEIIWEGHGLGGSDVLFLAIFTGQDKYGNIVLFSNECDSLPRATCISALTALDAMELKR